MSSLYKILCLAHDPSLVIGDNEWRISTQPLYYIAHPQDNEWTVDHTSCDLLIGRYSYSLVEICCPPSFGRVLTNSHFNSHRDAEWVDVAWLRLLRHYYKESPIEPVRGIPQCWNYNRILRLRNVLDD
jgi:hypothetical protein